jgi:hypothetical protein
LEKGLWDILEELVDDDDEGYPKRGNRGIYIDV